jgi:hypothetical protein
MIDIKICRNCGNDVDCNQSPLLCDECIEPFRFRKIEYVGNETHISNLFKFNDPILTYEQWDSITRSMIESFELGLMSYNHNLTLDFFVNVDRRTF